MRCNLFHFHTTPDDSIFWHLILNSAIMKPIAVSSLLKSLPCEFWKIEFWIGVETLIFDDNSSFTICKMKSHKYWSFLGWRCANLYTFLSLLIRIRYSLSVFHTQTLSLSHTLTHSHSHSHSHSKTYKTHALTQIHWCTLTQNTQTTHIQTQP